MNSKTSIREEGKDEASEDDEYKFTELHIKKPFYNWKLAEADHGLVFEAIASDGFQEFVKEKLIHDFLCVRKSYILRDYTGLRFWIHKFKGSFK